VRPRRGPICAPAAGPPRGALCLQGGRSQGKHAAVGNLNSDPGREAWPRRKADEQARRVWIYSKRLGTRASDKWLPPRFFFLGFVKRLPRLPGPAVIRVRMGPGWERELDAECWSAARVQGGGRRSWSVPPHSPTCWPRTRAVWGRPSIPPAEEILTITASYQRRKTCAIRHLMCLAQDRQVVSVMTAEVVGPEYARFRRVLR